MSHWRVAPEDLRLGGVEEQRANAVFLGVEPFKLGAVGLEHLALGLDVQRNTGKVRPLVHRIVPCDVTERGCPEVDNTHPHEPEHFRALQAGGI